MARPSKTAKNTRGHRTKSELEQREAAEKAALTGIPIRESAEIKADAVAHGEFLRVLELLTAVEKNDALYESVINDYCMLKSDILEYRKYKEDVKNDIDELMNSDMDNQAKYKLKAGMYKSVVDFDKQIQAAQKKRFDIEKENGFTIASALRAIPKKPVTKNDPLLEALRGDADAV